MIRRTCRGDAGPVVVPIFAGFDEKAAPAGLFKYDINRRPATRKPTTTRRLGLQGRAATR